jgi:hypothetical protein
VHQGDDQIVIPRVVHSLSTKRVLTLELIGGVDYATFCAQASQEDRNAAGETLARFMFRALYGHGLLYADPHPGNYRFLGGGKVAFLDFGCHKRLPPTLVAGMKRYVVALQRGDMDEFYRVVRRGARLRSERSGKLGPLHRDYTQFVLRPLVTDEPFTYTKRVRARERRVSRPRWPRHRLQARPSAAESARPAADADRLSRSSIGCSGGSRACWPD